MIIEFKKQDTRQTTQVVAPIQEMFSSIQGEALYVGYRQLFVRFAHCHLKCTYCDTPMTTETGECFVEQTPGSSETYVYPNPMNVETAYDCISILLAQAKHHSVSFTGGEPLLYHSFLRELFPLVQQVSKTYLETSGTQPDFLEPVLPFTDHIAMDIKLSSATGERDFTKEHRDFYQLAKTNPDTELFIKLVFNETTPQSELEAVRAIVGDTRTPIILQPETDLETRQVHISPAKQLEVFDTLSHWFNDVRLIPQTHKMLSVR